MPDQYDQQDHGIESPAKAGVAVTPHDSTDLATPSRAIFVGVGGDLSVEFPQSGSAIVLKNVASGTWLPIRVTRVNSTSTTATDIVALW